MTLPLTGRVTVGMLFRPEGMLVLLIIFNNAHDPSVILMMNRD